MRDAIEVDGLRKAYGPVQAVDGLSFCVPRGVVFALLGPNGAGKTTTIECLEGFRRPDAGRVRVLGHDPWGARDRVVPAIGVMLQGGGGAWPAAHARELVRHYARLYRDPLPPEEVLERVGLTGRAATTRARELSGGEQQRLSLALALVGRPALLFLDEPTAAMDVHARHATWELVRDLRAEGATVVLTTHQMDEAERLADLIAVMDRGRLVACDRPQALLQHGDAGVRVRTPADIDAALLAAALGTAVRREGAGRFVVSAGAEAIPRITAWFAEQGHPVSEVSAVGAGLEEVFLRLTSERSA